MIDKEICEALFMEYHDRVYDFCFTYLKNSHAAEDCMQEVFMVLMKKKNKITFTENLQLWLQKTAKLVCKKYLSRNAKRFRNIDDFAESIPDLNASYKKPLSEKLYEILDKNDADLLIEYLSSDRSERKKIAERRGIKITALYEKIRRIKRRVMENIDKFEV